MPADDADESPVDSPPSREPVRLNEHPLRVERYEFACAGPIRIEAYGCVTAPNEPSLGLGLDWNRIERDSSLVIDTETM